MHISVGRSGFAVLRGVVLRGVLLCGALAGGTLGCSLPRTTLSATPELDGATEGTDASVPPSDGGGAEDAYVTQPTDGGCTTAAYCDGTRLVSCTETIDCAASGRSCEAAACVTLCAEGTTRCEGSASSTCNGGHWGPPSACALGCDGTACRAVATCTAYAAAGAIVLGTGTTSVMIDLCGGTETSIGVDGATCDDADGFERMITLDVPVSQTVTLDVRDADSDTAVDTIVYVRSACDVQSSELACDDDEPCDTTDGVNDACMINSAGELVQYGHSRVMRTFEPGRYFVFLDSIAGRRESDCGTVQLTVGP